MESHRSNDPGMGIGINSKKEIYITPPKSNGQATPKEQTWPSTKVKIIRDDDIAIEQE